MTRLRWSAVLAVALATAACGGGAVEDGPQEQAALSDPAPAPIERDVERLIGVSRERLREMLGPSSFTRRDGPAEIWRYATDDCFLTLFLHRGDQPRGGGMTVHHVEAHARTRAAQGWVNTRSCYGQILQQRGVAPAVSDRPGDARRRRAQGPG
jgi:hypothetical protein